MGIISDFKKALFGHIVPPQISTLVVTAKVVALDKHPNADRLRIVKLDTGKRIVEPVVCGATNFVVGDIVALALPGATITHNIHSEAHESFILEKATIRGVESQGMICAGFELGLSKEPESREQGVLIFSAGTKLGADVYKLLKPVE